MTPRNKLIGASVAIVIILGFGTLGFKLLTEWSWFESFYFTLITITTIGYTEPADLTENGRYFGQEIAARDLDCVLIETEDKADPIESEGYRILNGDATNEEVLKTAGIERARGVVCAVSSDPENLYITLTARDLNPEIYIVARANEASVIPRLTRAGADKVVSPVISGSRQMAQMLLKPAVADFIELASMAEELDLELEQIEIEPASGLAGSSVPDRHGKPGRRRKTGKDRQSLRRRPQPPPGAWFVKLPCIDYGIRDAVTFPAEGSAETVPFR